MLSQTPCSLYLSESGAGVVDGDCFVCGWSPADHDDFTEKRSLEEDLIRIRNYIANASRSHH